MPNWCSNVVTLSHKDPVMIERAVKSAADGELLNEFIPIPEELKETVANFDETEQTKANLEKYGYANWYDFCLSEWGTKWDISTNSVDRNPDGSITLSFETAWGPAIEAYRKFESMGFGVDATYYEPGMCFCGSYVDGFDETYEIPDTADEVLDVVPAYIDEMYGISEYMREYEEEIAEDEESA